MAPSDAFWQGGTLAKTTTFGVAGATIGGVAGARMELVKIHGLLLAFGSKFKSMMCPVRP